MGQNKQLPKRRVYEIYLNIQLHGLFVSTTFPVGWMSNITWMISGFRREVDENYSLLSYYAESSANALTTFRNNLSVLSSWVKNPRRKL
jgi:hypothetical protein